MKDKIKVSMFIGTGLISSIVALAIFNGSLKVILEKLKE